MNIVYMFAKIVQSHVTGAIDSINSMGSMLIFDEHNYDYYYYYYYYGYFQVVGSEKLMSKVY